ncbi:unnamed protein product [Symbiodinium necroappetens]|uniref:Uncharacterized protein n=1 Tax=Symbiodinium necroappetens TaxID=1628268 RepID=A0A813CB39_9DINO|nr:unnamed protein product [Symbiodinium necroappetens]
MGLSRVCDGKPSPAAPSTLAEVSSLGDAWVVGYTEGDLDGNSHIGSRDIFIMKFNSAGEWVWTGLHGSSASDTAHGLQVDASDNVFVTGVTEGDLDGNGSPSGRDMFLMKFSSAGTHAWTMQRGGSSGSTYGQSVQAGSGRHAERESVSTDLT